MEPKRTLHSGNLVRCICAEEEERFIKKLVDAEVASKEESFQILKVEDKEENFSFMEKESHNTIKNSMEQLKQ